jgi:hypothetical protein
MFPFSWLTTRSGDELMTSARGLAQRLWSTDAKSEPMLRAHRVAATTRGRDAARWRWRRRIDRTVGTIDRTIRHRRRVDIGWFGTHVAARRGQNHDQAAKLHAERIEHASRQQRQPRSAELHALQPASDTA